MTAAWVIGAGGLIGSSIARVGGAIGATSVPWHDAAGAAAALALQARRFREIAGDRPWTIVWAAGAITVASDEPTARHEVETFAGCLAAIRPELPAGPGSIALVSSAGGLHAGSTHPPFDADSPPMPTSPYGRAKLAQEAIATDAFEGRVPLVITRVSNAFGPGQDLGKMQGIVSRLARSAVLREPANIFVPLSTVRDYIYVDDAARAVLAWAQQMRVTQVPVRTVLVASGIGTSLAQLIRTVHDVAHRKVPVALGAHPSAAFQALDLRFVPTPLDHRPLDPLTPLPVGVRSVVDDIRTRVQLEGARAR